MSEPVRLSKTDSASYDARNKKANVEQPQPDGREAYAISSTEKATNRHSKV